MSRSISSFALAAHKATRDLAKLSRELHRQLKLLPLKLDDEDTKHRLGILCFHDLFIVAAGLPGFDKYIDVYVIPEERELLRQKLATFSEELRSLFKGSSTELTQLFIQMANYLEALAHHKGMDILHEPEAEIRNSMIAYVLSQGEKSEQSKQLAVFEENLLRAKTLLQDTQVARSTENLLEIVLQQLDVALDRLEVEKLLKSM